MTRVASVADIPEGEARRFTLEGIEVAVVNAGGYFYAINDICSHEHFHLSDGEVDPETLTLECPKHGSAFSLESGRPLSLPALMPVPTYGVRVEGDDVLVEMLLPVSGPGASASA